MFIRDCVGFEFYCKNNSTDTLVSTHLSVLERVSAQMKAHTTGPVVEITPALSKGFKGKVKVHLLNMGLQGPHV